MKFTKRPITIEARRITPKNYGDVAFWCGGNAVRGGEGVKPYIRIPTLEGTMTGDLNDWVIKGVEGEFYPCKPDIFAATYDPVMEDTPAPCNCGACEADGRHWSDCAVHGVDIGHGVAYDKPCDCDGSHMSPAQINVWRNYNDGELEAAIQSSFVQGWNEGHSDIAAVIEKMEKR